MLLIGQLGKINPKTDKPYTLVELNEIHEELVEAQIKGFQEAVRTIANNWKPLVNALVGDLSTIENRSALRQIQFLSQELSKQLSELGYDKLAKKYLQTGYPDSVAFAIRTAEVTIAKQTVLSPLMPGILKQAMELDLSAFHYIGQKSIQELTKQTTMNAVVGVPRKTMLQPVEKTLDGELAGKASLYVDTATRLFDRTATMKVWDEAGITRFEYLGPVDNKTRPFCREHVGKAFELVDIKKMDNGQGLPALQYGGGYRCRHHWSPAHVESDYPEYPTKKKRAKKDSRQMSLLDK